MSLLLAVSRKGKLDTVNILCIFDDDINNNDSF